MPLSKADTVEIRFPSLGVRRSEVQERAASAVSYPSVWGCNVRLEDALDRRQRGGSRTGLEKFVPDKLGTTIADMANMNVSSAGSGASEILVVLVDSTIKTVENGSVTAYGAAPASGFFVTGRHNAYVITTSSIVKVNPQTGSRTTTDIDRMASIQAFRGLRYDLGHVGSLSDVVAPPYDVIDDVLRDQLYEKHPANVIRLMLESRRTR